MGIRSIDEKVLGEGKIWVKGRYARGKIAGGRGEGLIKASSHKS